MDLSAFLSSLRSVRELGSIVQIATKDVRQLKSLGIGVDIVPTATSAAIVLCVARFEDYLKGAAEKFLEMYVRAQPQISRSQLHLDLQLAIVHKNITSATQKTRHGVIRSQHDIKRNIEDVARKVLADQIWGDDAISTHSNPGPETVKEILKLLGISNPWASLEAEFAPRWLVHQGNEPQHKSIPSASRELGSILGWRNICAHSSGVLPIGSREVWETIAFFEVLSASIDALLQRESTDRITGLQSSPALWT